jgi:phenylacetate-CoA ligase
MIYRLLYRLYDIFIFQNKISGFLREQENAWTELGFSKKITLNKKEELSITTKAAIRLKLKNTKIRKFWRVGKTGGSTGESLFIPMSRSRAALNTASFLFWNQKAGYRLGAPYMVFRAKPRSRFLQWLRNETVITPRTLGKEDLEAIAHQIDNRSIEFIIGYPSILLEIAKLDIIRNLSFNLKGIVTVSEASTRYERDQIALGFGCNVFDRYSCEEVGLIAQEFDGNYIWNTFNLDIKLVNAGIGIYEIYISDSYQDAFNMLDYDLGDLVCVNNLVLNRVEGRKADIITNTKGEVVPALFLGPPIYNIVARCDFLTKFRFVQEGFNSYCITFEGSHLPKKNDLAMLESGLKSKLGIDADIKFRSVEKISSLGAAGKHLVYLNRGNTEI